VATDEDAIGIVAGKPVLAGMTVGAAGVSFGITYTFTQATGAAEPLDIADTTYGPYVLAKTAVVSYIRKSSSNVYIALGSGEAESTVTTAAWIGNL